MLLVSFFKRINHVVVCFLMRDNIRQIVRTLMDEFRARLDRDQVRRDIDLPEIEGKADVIIGMRRAGKTWYLFQEMNRLLAREARRPG
jgi:predicted AAA+ superfamily ATPase